MLSPSMIFHTAISFMTNTNQQHYSGEVHLSYFSQIFFVCWKQILSPVIGLAALVAIIRGLARRQAHGQFLFGSVAWRGLFLRSLESDRGRAADRRRFADDTGRRRPSDHCRSRSDGDR